LPAKHAAAALKGPDDKLRSLLGITDVNFVRGKQRLATMDRERAHCPVAGEDPANTRFNPEVSRDVQKSAHFVVKRLGHPKVHPHRFHRMRKVGAGDARG
jgi:hypothetical protein